MLLLSQFSFLPSTMRLCSKTGKAILRLPESERHLSQKATHRLHILKIFISFNHLIPGKSNQASSLSTSFGQWQRLSLEYCACQANALSVNYSLSPPFPSEAIENHSLNHPRATDYHTGPSCLIANVFNPPKPLGFVALGISE